MGAKWTIIGLLGLMAGIRLIRPQFFFQWTTGKLDENEPLDWRVFLLMWSVLLATSYLSLHVVFDEMPWSYCLILIPSILLLRVLLADILAQLFKPDTKYMPWLNMRRLPQLALVYLGSTILILSSHWMWPTEKGWELIILALGHGIGLVIFSIKHQGFTHFTSVGVRIYAVLYLCALELTPLYLAMG